MYQLSTAGAGPGVDTASIFLESCTSTAATPDNLELVASAASCLRGALNAGDHAPLRELLRVAREWQANVSDVLGAAVQVVADGLIALARELKGRGHEVMVETWEHWREAVEAEGLTFTAAQEYTVYPPPAADSADGQTAAAALSAPPALARRRTTGRPGTGPARRCWSSTARPWRRSTGSSTRERCSVRASRSRSRSVAVADSALTPRILAISGRDTG